MAKSSAQSPLHRAGLVALAGVAGAALLFSPVKLCLVALALRIPCPGCGMTRATVALLRGEVAQAIALHPLSPVIVPCATGWIVAQTVGYVRGRGTLRGARIPRSVELLAAALAFLLLGVWVARFFGFFGGPVSLT
ncbi:MAG TPA: DUF2752 domain-containing protein [Polyangiaceae bacterium]|nr:DUF2752 domain-containing protein [Polyangiaceae bacterium]